MNISQATEYIANIKHFVRSAEMQSSSAAVTIEQISNELLKLSPEDMTEALQEMGNEALTLIGLYSEVGNKLNSVIASLSTYVGKQPTKQIDLRSLAEKLADRNLQIDITTLTITEKPLTENE